MLGPRRPTTQVIAGEYLRKERLIMLLDSLFYHQWELEMIDGLWHLRSPRPLTDYEIQSCLENRSSSQNPHREEHLEATAAFLSPPERSEYSTLVQEHAIESSSDSGISPFLKTSGGSPSPSKINEASGAAFSSSKRSGNWSEISSRLNDRIGRGDITSVVINGKTLPKRSISKSIEALGKSRSMSGSSEYSGPGQNLTIQSSAQGDITVTVEDAQLVGGEVSSYVLVIKGWRGANKNGIEIQEHDYENISEGHTSTVFEVHAVVTRSNTGTDRVGRSFVTKLAVKRLKREINPTKFDEEYQSLYAVSRVRHPNIVTFLGAFLYEEDNSISRNFLFPMAIGDMEQVFSGSINHNALSQCSDTLWAQFEGLASAIQFLHDRYHMVHRDIKPSNILIYKNADGLGLIAKLADFGLAKNNTVGSDKIRKLLRYEDVWKLGTVFAELLIYLWEGTKGVNHFRGFINISEGILYNENSIKSEIILWLRSALRDHSRGKEVAEITMRTLGTQDECPSAAEVSKYLADSSNACFFDGRRFVHFTTADSIPEPSIFDKTRSFIEQRFGPIYWWPLPPVQYPCPTGSKRIEWKWCTHDLFVDLPSEVVKVYKEKCCTILSSLPPGPLLPMSNTETSSFVSGSGQSTSSNTVIRQHSTNKWFRPSGIGSGPIPIASASASQSDSQVSSKQLYWCVDKAWVEPSETWLCIEDPHRIAEDRILCLRLKDLYDSVRGLRGRYLSWKACLGIKFTSFNRLYDGKDQVICMSIGLPKPPEYEYALFQPELVHMAIASRQILAGIHDPSKVEGNNTLEMIPKKVDALLKPDKGAEGWGLHAVQGWSLWKIVLWMAAFTIIGLLFVVLWLVLVDPKDLQNAFTPGAFLVTMLCLALGIPQFLDAA